MTEPETLFVDRHGVGAIILNRPRVLNALSPSQFHELDKRLEEWQDDDRIRVVTIEGAGDRAFCAGGDIRAVWDARARGDDAFNRAIFRAEYRMDRRIHHFPKPYVALMDGIVMGGGAGVSVNGAFRVATERTLFAMPECAIGFFPDVGATHFLSRCPGRIGLYLGLTGTRLGPSDCLWAGLATHYIPAADLGTLKEALARAAGSADAKAAVAQTLADFHKDPGLSDLEGRAEAIDRCFAHATLREVISALVAEGADWSWAALDPIGDNAPLSLAVTFRQLGEGRGLTLDEALRREYRLACKFLAGQTFYEGIRALVVDKDKRPMWEPQSLADVSEAQVSAMFAPLDIDELEFPRL